MIKKFYYNKLCYLHKIEKIEKIKKVIYIYIIVYSITMELSRNSRQPKTREQPITEQERVRRLGLEYIKPYQNIDINYMGNGNDITFYIKFDIAHYMLNKQIRIFETINTNITDFFDIVETDRSRTEPKSIAKDHIINQINYLLNLFNEDYDTLAKISTLEFYNTGPKYELFLRSIIKLRKYFNTLRRVKRFLGTPNPSRELVTSRTSRILRSMNKIRAQLAEAIAKETEAIAKKNLSNVGGQHSKTKKRRNKNIKRRCNKTTKRHRHKSIRSKTKRHRKKSKRIKKTYRRKY